VAIGRNEGERLRRCLQSLDSRARPTVYVDSGSTDGSPELARSLGAEVVSLDLSVPFTAARARNTGFDYLLGKFPSVEYVQFVDGDCEVDSGWLPAAMTVLETDPKIVVVCGRRRERRPEASVYNLLCDVEWDTPIGEAIACGGDALMRVNAFKAVGGFRADLIARAVRPASRQCWANHADRGGDDAARRRYDSFRSMVETQRACGSRVCRSLAVACAIAVRHLEARNAKQLVVGTPRSTCGNSTGVFHLGD
jgi:glycosyltransferase involved in cell wall biosynthesis